MDFDFSIILAIYNQEKWIDRALESLVHQSLGFEEHVQVILVNDGSHDTSPEICEAWADKFPKNIVVIHQHNMGVSAARNAGLAVARGRLINFLDPDDYFLPETLQTILDFAEDETGLDLPAFGLPLTFVGAKSGVHGKYLDFPEGKTVISIDENPHLFFLSASATFYRLETIRNERFNLANKASEDSEFNLNYLLKYGPKWGFVKSENAGYMYWQHDSAVSSVSSQAKSLDPLLEILGFLEGFQRTKQFDKAFIRSASIYLLRPRIEVARKKWFTDESQWTSLLQRIKKLLIHISYEEIIDSPWLKRMPDKLVFLRLKSPHGVVAVNERGQLTFEDVPIFWVADLPIEFYRLNTQTDYAEIEVAYFSYGAHEVDLVLEDANGRVVTATDLQDVESVLSPRRGDVILSPTSYRKYRLPVDIKENFWKFKFRVANETYDATYFAQKPSSRFYVIDESLKAVGPNYWVRFQSDRRLFIRRAPSSNWLYNLRTTLRIYRKHRKIIPARLFNRFEKTNILINDRPKFGDDNGEALFEYIQNERPDLSRHTWMVLDETAPSYNKLKGTKRIVKPGSFKHKVLYLNAKIVLSSHLAEAFNSPWQGREKRLCADILDQTFIWLQHGVTKDTIDNEFNRLRRTLDGLVVATNHEITYAQEPKHFHTDTSIIKSGFPRFDLLEGQRDTSVDSILFMPTWRSWLTGKILSDGTHARISDFASSLYFENHKRILTNTAFHAALRKRGVMIEFVMHPGMAAYYDLYKNFESETVRIFAPGTVSYKSVLSRGKLMITDYSSVFFDFAYMGKPVLFLQDDVEQYRHGHYAEGVFEYGTMAPGAVLDTVDDLLSAVEKIIDAQFQMSPEELQKLKDLFLYRDKRNSQRTIDSALAIDNGRRGNNLQSD